MAMKKFGILLALGVAVGAAAYSGKARAKKKSSKPGKAESPTVVDSGVGYAEDIGINVNWSIIRFGASEYSWRWTARDPGVAEDLGVQVSDDSDSPFGSEEEAFGALTEAIGLRPLPIPPVGEDGVGIPPLPEPPIPPAHPNPDLLPPGGMGIATVPDGPGPIAEPPVFAVTVFPDGASPARLPPLTNMGGVVFSEDQRVVGIGPLFWDKIGEQAEELMGSGVTTAPEMLNTISGEVFPMEEIHLFVGPGQLYEAIGSRVREYLETALG